MGCQGGWSSVHGTRLCPEAVQSAQYLNTLLPLPEAWCVPLHLCAAPPWFHLRLPAGLLTRRAAPSSCPTTCTLATSASLSNAGSKNPAAGACVLFVGEG